MGYWRTAWAVCLDFTTKWIEWSRWTGSGVSSLLLVAIVWSNSLAQEPASEQVTRRNILLILTDDQGWPTLGCYGGTKVPTPHLDRLAAEGTRFTDAYVTSQCTPTRATLLTGQYTIRHGLWHVLPWYGYPYAAMTEPVYRENFPRGRMTIAKALQDAGYRTGIVGKWHLTSNEDGNYMGLRPGGAGHYGFDYAPEPIPKTYFSEGQDRGVELLTEQALEFIGESKEQPWFCLLSHHMIHGKVVAPQDVEEKYLRQGYRKEGPDRAVYLAGLECIDRSVGKLRRQLDQMGELDDTVIIFLSDNGGIYRRQEFRPQTEMANSEPKFEVDLIEYSNAPLREGKGSIYEGGVRVPWIIFGPGVASQQVIAKPVHCVDLFPTILDFAGVQLPPDYELDGLSLLPLVDRSVPVKADENTAFDTRSVFQYYPFYDLRWGLTPSASIRKGTYKLIEFFGDRVNAEPRYRLGARIELYNLRTDIGEEENLAVTLPEKSSELRSELRSWLEQFSGSIPVTNRRFEDSRAFFETRTKTSWLTGKSWQAD